MTKTFKKTSSAIEMEKIMPRQEMVPFSFSRLTDLSVGFISHIIAHFAKRVVEVFFNYLSRAFKNVHIPAGKNKEKKCRIHKI